MIQDLLSDAELLDLLSRSLQEQVAEVTKFVDIYVSASWSVLHEKGSKKAQQEGKSLMEAIQDLSDGCSERLGTLVKLSQNLIQLVIKMIYLSQGNI